jgi:hypothetical protein
LIARAFFGTLSRTRIPGAARPNNLVKTVVTPDSSMNFNRP